MAVTDGALISTVTSLLKNVYLPGVVEQLNNEVLLFDRITKTNDFTLVGNQIVIAHHKGRSGGIGGRGETDALPAAGYQRWGTFTYDLSQQYGRGQVSGLALAKTKSNAGSFLEVLKSEIDYLKNDLHKDLARQAYGNSDGNAGGNGRIAKCGTTTTTNVVVLNSDEPLRKGHLYVNMLVDIGTAGSPTSLINGEAITAVSIANKTITVTTSISTTTANFVSRHGSAGKEINGLQSIISTAANSLGGVDASSAGNEYWDNQRDTSTTTLTLDKMQSMWNTVRVAGANVANLTLLTSFGIQRSYFGLLSSQVRYVDPMDFKAGYSALAFNNRPLVADVDAKFGSLFFLDEDALKNYENEDWHFLDKDGDVLKWVIGYDSWEFALAKYFQIGAVRRNTSGVMSALTDTTGV